MPTAKSLLAALVSLAALPAPALAASTPGSAGKGSALRHALLSSHELWATVDVCSPTDQPNTIGIRGSMPGDGRARDKMYMSFRLQYLDAPTNRWTDLSSASSSYVAVGTGASPRQGGRSFQLVPGKTAYTMRGVVDFQWRRGKKVLESAARPTTAGHRSLAGADPAGFSVATCAIG
ncbi:MAG: hypothetical protein JWL67_2676 [Solirubrobacterales bacterium]|jgi:hypothetical protein|nr:hypothetical protein [Solirubrobacterales bacterium]